MPRNPSRAGMSGGIHTLVPATPPRRLGVRSVLGVTLALSAGVFAGLIWLAQDDRGSVQTLPTAVAQAPAAATAAADTETVEAARVAAEASTTDNASLRTLAASASLPAQARPLNLTPPTPTATLTPLPPVASVEGVVGLGGGDLFDERGAYLDYVIQGALLEVSARSSDGAWLAVATTDGQEGWMASEAVIVFDAGRLRRVDITILSATPTPAVQLPTPTPSAARVTGDGPSARVTLQDSRLNLRAGPGAGYAIIAKAQPDAVYTVLARNAAGDWYQLALPDLSGGFAWAVATYLELDGAAADLPVSAAISSAPSFGEPSAPAAPAKVTPDAQGRKVAPVPSPTGLTGTLAIQTDWGGDIYLYNLATGDLRLLTGGFDPAISPGGKQVAFTRAGGEHGLYLIGIDGSNERRIFNDRELFFSPKWRPDGGAIVFERGDEFIYCVQRGRACIKATPDPLDPDPNTERQQQLARVDVHGGNYQDVPSLARAHAPDWHANGIVYHSPAGIQKTQDRPDARSELVFFNIRKQYELDPDWQPGGDRIVFQRREASHWQIFSVNADGSGLTGLTRPEFTLVDELPSSVAPAWSPDGRHIVFLSNRMADHNVGPWRVWVMDADGSNQRPLPIDLPITYTFVGEQMLDWGP